MPPDRALLLTQAAATWLLVGLIWVIQLVHYPLFAQVGRDQFVAYERAHQQRITWIVGPAMLVELAAALPLVVRRPTGVPGWLAGLGVALLAVIWLATFLIQVPLHNRLGAGFDPAAHGLLVLSNWIRTAAWSARGFVALAMLAADRNG